MNDEILVTSSRVNPQWGGSKSLENWYEFRTLQTKQKTTAVIAVDVKFLHFLNHQYIDYELLLDNPYPYKDIQ